MIFTRASQREMKLRRFGEGWGGGKAMGERRFILPAVLANRHNPFVFSSEFKGNSYAQP